MTNGPTRFLGAVVALLVGCHGPDASDGGDVADVPDAIDRPQPIADVPDTFVADRNAPTWPVGATVEAIGGIDRVLFSWPMAMDDIAVTQYRVTVMGGRTVMLDAATRTFTVDGLALDASATVDVVALDAAGNASVAIRGTGTASVPDPARTAPPLRPFEGGPVARHSRFLFEGNPPVQVGVRPGSIEDQRIAVVRGRVIDRAGMPVRRARVSILGSPEFGYTLTRDDGRYDLAMNGGGPITVAVDGANILNTQRRFEPNWQAFTDLADIVSTGRDATMMPLDTSGMLATSQVVRGPEVRDAVGVRRPLLYLRPNTRADLVMPDRTLRPAPSLRVHLTEFTGGDRSRSAMPGDLPANSAFTYAAELFAEEAQSAGAKSVQFSTPVRYYVEPTIAVPVGSAVPLGFFQNEEDQWNTEESGVALRLLSVAAGLANIDSNGDNLPDDAATLTALEMDDDERRALGAAYVAPTTLWRMKLSHFSWPDFNFARWFSGAFSTPPGRDAGADASECRSPVSGSIVYCESQVLAERVPIAGMGVFLHYQTDRVPGFVRGYTLKIPLTGPRIDPTLRRVELEVNVAGQQLRRSFAPMASQLFTYTWDGRDAFGRLVQGTQQAVVRVGFVYEAVVSTQAGSLRLLDFGLNTGETPGRGAMAPLVVTPGRADDELVVWRRWEQPLGVWNVRHEGLGGWALSAQQRYDPVSQSVLEGDGTIRSATAMGAALRTVAGTGRSPVGGEIPRENVAANSVNLNAISAITIGPDGTIYVADGTRVRAITSNGIMRTIAGTGVRGDAGDGGAALAATLQDVRSLAVRRDGSLLIGQQTRIRRLRADAVIEAFAGTSVAGDSGDGGLRLMAQFRDIRGLVVLADGSIAVGDQSAGRVRRITNTGIVTTMLGNGITGDPTYDGPATRSRVREPGPLAVTPEGVIYVGTRGRVLRVDPDGNVRHVVGLRVGAVPSSDGGLAEDFPLQTAVPQIALGRDGTLYVADTAVVLAITDGIARVLTRVSAVNGRNTPDGANAKGASVYEATALFAHPNGALWIGEGGAFRLRALSPPFPGLPVDEVIVPTPDGTTIDVFNSEGRHERVLDARNGRLLQRFFYTPAGHLDRIEDDSMNVLRIERDARGVATAIIAPFGQRTVLTVNAQGDLTDVRDPVNRVWHMSYTGPTGLLADFTDPRMNVHRFAYNALALLERDTGPDGAVVGLTRTEMAGGFEVSMQPALGNSTRFRMVQTGSGQLEHRTIGSNGLSTITRMPRDATVQRVSPDGMTVTSTAKPDSRWGMRAPLAQSVTVATPRGLMMTSSQDRTVTLSDPNDVTSVSALIDTVLVNGRRSERRWETATRTWTLRSPEGRVTTVLEDAQGRIAEARVAGMEPLRWTYDARGRVETVIQGDRTQRISYDARGFAVTSTDPLMRQSMATLDDVGRITRATTSDGRALSLGFDEHDNLTSATPPGRMAHSFRFTGQDLLREAVPPLAGDGDPTERTDWDPMLRPTLRTLAGGRIVGFTYDAANRPETITTAEGVYRISYDPATGQVAGVSNPAGPSLAFSYDGSLLTEERTTGVIAGTVAHSFDSDFRLTHDIINATTDVAYGYDRDNLLTSAGPVSLVHNAMNGLLERVNVGMAQTVITADSFGAPRQIATSVAGTSILDEALTFDSLGRITAKTEVVEGRRSVIGYAFDVADRLSEVRRDGVVTERYSYDSNGNRLSAMVDGVTRMGMSDAQDRLTNYGDFVYSYNREGQRIEQRDTRLGQSTRFEYDVGGALRAVVLPDGRRVEYVIDSVGRRVGRRVNGALTNRWIYRDGLRPIAALDALGAVESVFVYGSRANVPDVILRGGRVYRVVSDHLGSVRRVVDSVSGNIVQRLSYDTYGRVIEDSAPGWQPFGFAGGLYDPDTKLVLFGARNYDPVSGRWTSKDPSGLSGGLNVYEYANGDPSNWVDVDGEYAVPVARVLILGTIGAVSSGLGTYLEQKRSHSATNWRTIATSAAVGFVSGALTPHFGTTFLGGAALGGFANLAQTGINTLIGENRCQDAMPVQAFDSFVLGALSGAVQGWLGGKYIRASRRGGIVFDPIVGSSRADLARAARLNWGIEQQANVSVRGFLAGVVGAWTASAPFSAFRAELSGVDPSRPYGF